MYSKLAIAATAAVAAGLAYAQNIVVNTPPTLIECQPVQISWTGGAAPFYPRVTQGGQVANTLKTFDMTSSQSLTWTVDQPANTAVTIVVSDSTGATGATDQVTVQSGSTSCLGAAGSSSASGSSSSSAPASSSSSAAAGSSSSSAPASSSSSSAARSSSSSGSASRSSSSATGSSSSSAAPAASRTSTDGAVALGGSFTAVVAGIVGVAVAALA